MHILRNNPPPGKPVGGAAIDTAVRLLGGAIAPTKRALAAAGLQLSDSAIHDMRVTGRMPVHEDTFGGGNRYYVTAGAFAAAFLMPPAAPQAAPAANDGGDAEPALPRKRGPGRPRKYPRRPVVTEREGRRNG